METLTLALLITETILLLLTIVLLYLSTREQSERRKLLESMIYTTRMLSTEEYFHIVTEGFLDARKEVLAIVSGRKPKSDSEWERLARIIKVIKRAVKRGVNVKFIIPAMEDRVQVAYMYKEAGAEIKFMQGLILNEMRTMIIDNKISIIGLPEKTGRGQPTRKGYKIPSRLLSGLLKQEFEKFWNSSDAYTFEDYLKKTVKTILTNHPNIDSDSIAKHLEIPRPLVEKIIEEMHD